MPALFAEMRADVLRDTSGTKREFFPYNDGAICAPGPDTFYYAPSVHANLTSMLAVLENHQYIVDVTATDAKRYRMTEEFVGLLKVPPG